MAWVLAAGVVWLVVAVLVAGLLGRAIRMADRREQSIAAPEALRDSAGVDPDPASQAPSRTPPPSAEPTAERQQGAA